LDFLGTHDEIYGNMRIIGKTLIEFKSISKMVIKQSEAKQSNSMGKWKLNNPMPLPLGEAKGEVLTPYNVQLLW
jgi:hypothetical protein